MAIKTNSLGKNERLKSRKLIEKVFGGGKAVNLFPFRIAYMKEGEEPLLKAGFGVSTRNFKRAVDRNRIKRLMKEAYRHQKAALQNSVTRNQHSVFLFILFTGKQMPEYSLIFENMNLIFERLLKKLDESHSSNS